MSWNYMQCNSSADVIGDIVKLFKENGIIKTRNSVVKELYNQFLINKEEFENLLKKENEKPTSSKTTQESNETRDDEISKLCQQLRQDGMPKFLDWVQIVLLKTCFAKIYLEKMKSKRFGLSEMTVFDKHGQAIESLLNQPAELPVMSPVSYHSLRKFQFLHLFYLPANDG